jgi:hypothetical protein
MGSRRKESECSRSWARGVRAAASDRPVGFDSGRQGAVERPIQWLEDDEIRGQGRAYGESLVRRDGDDLLYGGGGDHCSLLFFWVWLEMAPGEEEAATTPLTAETAVTHWTEATGGTHA